jgi:hypothetical protein
MASRRRKKARTIKETKIADFIGSGLAGSRRLAIQAHLLANGKLQLSCTGRSSRRLNISAVLDDDAVTRAFAQCFQLTDIRLRSGKQSWD